MSLEKDIKVSKIEGNTSTLKIGGKEFKISVGLEKLPLRAFRKVLFSLPSNMEPTPKQLDEIMSFPEFFTIMSKVSVSDGVYDLEMTGDIDVDVRSPVIGSDITLYCNISMISILIMANKYGGLATSLSTPSTGQ